MWMKCDSVFPNTRTLSIIHSKTFWASALVRGTVPDAGEAESAAPRPRVAHVLVEGQGHSEGLWWRWAWAEWRPGGTTQLVGASAEIEGKCGRGRAEDVKAGVWIFSQRQLARYQMSSSSGFHCRLPQFWKYEGRVGTTRPGVHSRPCPGLERNNGRSKRAAVERREGRVWARDILGDGTEGPWVLGAGVQWPYGLSSKLRSTAFEGWRGLFITVLQLHKQTRADLGHLGVYTP